LNGESESDASPVRSLLFIWASCAVE